MRILLITSFAPPHGGLTAWTTQYLNGMENTDNNIICVNTNYIGFDKIVSGKRNLFYELKRSFRIWRDTVKESRKKPDVAHLCSPCSLSGCLRDIVTLILVFLCSKKTKRILHCHCNLVDYVGEGKLHKTVFKLFLKLTDGVFVMNEQSERYMNCLSYEPLWNIPNCIQDVQHEITITESIVSKNDEMQVLFLGRQTHAKGVDVVLQVAKLAQQRGANIHFHIVGDENTYTEQFMPFPANVTNHGQKDHDSAMAFMKQADAFLFPSRTEGFPYVVLEAMMTETAIVASDVGAIREMVSGTGAYVADSFNAEEYLNALVAFCDKETRQQAAEQGRTKYLSHYTPAAVTTMILDAYQKLIRG